MIPDTLHAQQLARKGNALVFLTFWIVAFIIYLPAAKAGMVGDFPDWLNHIRNTPFKEYMNWNIGGVTTLYQFTQLVTYVLYKIIGAYHWPWHIIMLSMHVTCCFLLYRIFKQLLNDTGVTKGDSIAWWIGLLFCVSPYASEVVVYEPCFHFSMSLMMMFFILLCVQRYMTRSRAVYAWLAGLVYFASTYSLELFYLTPFFTFTLLLFYYRAGSINSSFFKKCLLLFLVPQLFFFGAEQVVFHLMYGSKPPHSIYLTKDMWQVCIANPPKFLFHVLLDGRYFPEDTKQAVYMFLQGKIFLFIFYGVLFVSLITLLARFKTMRPKGKVLLLVLSWTMAVFLFVMPLWFYDTFHILFDRYAYFPAVFIYALVVILLSYISKRYVVAAVLSILAIINTWFTFQTNLIWQRSAAITHTLLRTFPDVGNKTVLLLNTPQCYNGALMLRAIGESDFKLMRNLFYPGNPINNKVWDVASYNMLTPQDGAHVMVVYDSVCHVTLNQFGNYWWYNDHGARSYENEDYKVNMADVGHWYTLTLKHPASQYVVLYTVDDQWRVVDWSKRNNQY